jgi:hypothetical protein
MKRAVKQVLWVRYEAGASLLDLLRVSRETEVAHRRLCDYHWQSGRWPAADGADAGVLCRAGEGEWPQTMAELARLGWVQRKGRLYHSGVHRVRANAVAALQAQRRGGATTAKQRWGDRPARAEAPSPGGSPSAECGTRNAELPAPLRTASGDAASLDSSATSSPGSSPTSSPDRSPAAVLPIIRVNDKEKSKTERALSADRLTRSGSARKSSAGEEKATATGAPGSSPQQRPSGGEPPSESQEPEGGGGLLRTDAPRAAPVAVSNSARAEKSFLADVKEMLDLWHPGLAKTELANWGGWWRNRFRENPDKARRVLADVASLIREHRITENAGAAAVDLWKRLP